jgi:hypothetical protein
MSQRAISEIAYAAIFSAILPCQAIGLIGPREWPTIGQVIDFFTEAGVGRRAVLVG